MSKDNNNNNNNNNNNYYYYYYNNNNMINNNNNNNNNNNFFFSNRYITIKDRFIYNLRAPIWEIIREIFRSVALRLLRCRDVGESVNIVMVSTKMIVV